jgi:hypothetical protein
MVAGVGHCKNEALFSQKQGVFVVFWLNKAFFEVVAKSLLAFYHSSNFFFNPSIP